MLPTLLKPVLWSYDFSLLDAEKHRRTIMRQVMEYGTQTMIDWLRQTYTRAELLSFLSTMRPTELSVRSKNFWQTIL